MRSRIAAALLILVCLPLSAQSRRPASPNGRSAVEVQGRYDDAGRYVGGRWIEIFYGRPIRRGRSIFGPPDFAQRLNDGAPVWRAGANQTTRLVTEVPLVFGEVVVAPGEYTVFVQLTLDAWTFIVTTWPAQTSYDQHDRSALFGAFHYMPNRDVVRRPMRVVESPYSYEQLSWDFVDVTPFGGSLALRWDDRIALVDFEFGR